MNSSDDEKLDAMLRDVSVPSGLMDRLREIPNEPVVGIPDSNWKIGRRVIGLALAAGLAGIVIWIAWPPAPSQLPVAMTPDSVTAEDELKKLELDRMNELALEIEMLSKRLELRELESKLRDLERTAPIPSLSIEDTESLVLCLADQSAIAWGAEPESVRADMQKIIEMYPHTAGARTANEFLARATDQNSMKP